MTYLYKPDVYNILVWNQNREWQKVFTSCTSDRRLKSRIYKQFSKIKKTNDPIRKQSIDLNRELSKEEIKVDKKHLKMFNIFGYLGMQINTTSRFHFTKSE